MRRVCQCYRLCCETCLSVQVLTPVLHLCSTLAAWLNLSAGTSRSNTNKFLQALQLILATTLQLIFSVFQSAGYNVETPSLNIPRDIRTIYGQGLEPEIIRTACCPKCYTQYPADAIPSICRWKKSPVPQARECKTELWKDRKTSSGSKRVPVALYSTQSFKSWLEFFLSRPHIEEHLHSTTQQYQQSQWHEGAPMHDIHQSPAWRTLGNFLLYPYHLVWGIYVDYFNPFTNKIAGKSLTFF